MINLGKQIQLRIYPSGKIEAKTIGVKGKQCTDYIPLLEQALKALTVESAYTDEYYQGEVKAEINEISQIINK